MSKKLTTEEFIKRANTVHGGKYDYSKVNYVNNHTKVTIICPIHGEFKQNMINHINGKQGCPICGGTKKLTTEEFIKKSKRNFGDKYDYSKVNYVNNRTRVTIICPEHGEFEQTPRDHLSNKIGCPKCGGTEKLTTKIFIEKAKIKHGDKYEYSKVNYINSHEKVTITCLKHGDFYQRPNDHLSGYGCPKCRSSSLEELTRNLLKSKNIRFKEQMSWDWLVYKGKQKVDFYLIDFNVVVECQGIQHFEERVFFEKEDTFEERLNRDRNKKRLCEEHGIKVFYFSNLGIDYPYKVYEDFETLINDIKNLSD